MALSVGNTINTAAKEIPKTLLLTVRLTLGTMLISLLAFSSFAFVVLMFGWHLPNILYAAAPGYGPVG